MAPRPALVLDRFVPYRLSVAANAVSQLVATAYTSLDGMSNHEWRVLAILADGGGRMSQGDVVQRSRMSKVPVSRAAQSLLERGWIRRSIDADDSRARLLELTAAGRAVYARVVPAALEREHAAIATLSAVERRQLLSLLHKVQVAAEDALDR